MSGMRITLQRLGTPTEGTGAEGAAATGEVVAWRDGDPAPDEPAVGTSDDSAAPPPTARLALAPEHPRVSARGETPETVRVVVIVPFREDGSGRESQLSALLARLRSMFLPGECLVVVAEQADDGRKFNRGQLLNAAFKHLRETHASSLDVRETLYCFHDCDMLPDASLAAHYLRGPPVPARSGEENDASSSSSSVGGFVRVLCADGGRYDADACFGGVTIYDQQGFEATNGYPNGFWGWGGGGQRAVPPLRARGPGARARARLSLRRPRGPRDGRGEAGAARRGGRAVRREGEETAFTGKRQVVANGRANGCDVRVFGTGANGGTDGDARRGKRGEDEKRKTKNAGAPVRVPPARGDRRRGGVRRVRRAQGAFGVRQPPAQARDVLRGQGTENGKRRSRLGAERRQDAARDGARIVLARAQPRRAAVPLGRKGGGPRRDARPIAPIRPILGARCSENTYEHRFSRNSISHHGSPVHGDVEAFVEAVFREARGSVFGVRREGPANVGVSETSRAQRRGRDADDVRALRRALREAEQALRAPQGVAMRRAGRGGDRGARLVATFLKRFDALGRRAE